ncbi:MAG TPA: tetraacyldisaccharide 4'-kinase [Armatimonadota bacterium]
MADTERILALMRGEGRGLKPWSARATLRMLSGLYGLGIGAYLALYRVGILKRVHLRPVVISVGNLTVGGAGKTTTIQYLAELLCREGLRPAVLSYGYRAGARDSVGVVSDGSTVLMSAAEAGDEAALLAGYLPGVPVLIGRRRVISGAEADQRFQPDVLLCDDAFQYWRLHRDIDLLLVDAVEPWGYGFVLPRGLMREPKRQARRADAILITHADVVPQERLKALQAELTRFGRPVWTSRHRAERLDDLNGKRVAALDSLNGLGVLAVSSLGDPTSFEAALTAAGAVVTPMRFADHHRYSNDDVRAAENRASEGGMQIVTTAKDAVKVRMLSPGAGWRVLRIALDVANAPSFDQWVTKAINQLPASR